MKENDAEQIEKETSAILHEAQAREYFRFRRVFQVLAENVKKMTPTSDKAKSGIEMFNDAKNQVDEEIQDIITEIEKVCD